MTTAPVRRRSLLLLTPAAALLGLSACGTAEESGGSDGGGTGASLLPAAEGTTSYPLTLPSPWGETTLDARPERIAVLSSVHDGEYLQMLGVTPVLAPDDITADAWMKDAFPRGIETTVEIPRDAMPFEAIAAARPDLIVSSFGIDEPTYTKLRSIAPVATVAVEAAPRAVSEDTWKDRLQRLAEALDLSAAGTAAIEDHDAQLQTVRDENPALQGRTITYAVYYDTETGLDFNNKAGSNSEAIFTEMGFATNPNGEKFVQDSTVSNELLPLLDADVLLISDNSSTGADGSGSTITTVKDLDLYKKLPVVAEGRTVEYLNVGGESFEIDGVSHEGNPAWALNVAGPLASVWTARTLAPILSETIAG